MLVSSIQIVTTWASAARRSLAEFTLLTKITNADQPQANPAIPRSLKTALTQLV